MFEMLQSAQTAAAPAIDTVRVTVVDTVAVVLPANESLLAVAAQTAFSIVSLLVSVAAAVAAVSAAKAAKAELDAVREANTAARRTTAAALQQHCMVLNAAIATLSKAGPQHAQLYEFAQITIRQIEDLETLARALGGEAPMFASKAAYSLRVLQRMIQEAKRIALNMGWYANEREQAEYAAACESAPRMLESLRQVCAREAA